VEGGFSHFVDGQGVTSVWGGGILRLSEVAYGLLKFDELCVRLTPDDISSDRRPDVSDR